MKLTRVLALTLLGLGATASQANAGFLPLPPGGSVTFTGGGSLSAYSVLASTTFTVASGPLAGSIVKEEVIQERNVQGLDFVYQVVPPSTDTKGLTAVSVASFAGFSTAVEYLGPGDYKPFGATRTSDGSTVTFDFHPSPRKPGNPQTEDLVIHTNATSFVSNGKIFVTLGTQGSTSTLAGNAFAPSAVPEPGTLLLGCGALPVLALCYARNRRKAARAA